MAMNFMAKGASKTTIKIGKNNGRTNGSQGNISKWKKKHHPGQGDKA